MATNIRFIYFIQAETGAVKIGLTTDIAKRLDTLQVGCPVNLKLLGYCEGNFRTEAAFHQQFAAHRIRGEWFSPHPDLIAFVGRIAKKNDQVAPTEQPPSKQTKEALRPPTPDERMLAKQIWSSTLLPQGSPERRFIASVMSGFAVPPESSTLLNFMADQRTKLGDYFHLHASVVDMANLFYAEDSH